MAQFSRLQVYRTMEDTGMVPIFYHPDAGTCKAVFGACYKGGVRVIEFTNRGDFAHEVFAELSKYVREELPGLALGAGTVLDAPTAALYIQLGADFIVAPSLNPEVAVLCNRRKIAWIPGCGTLSEISQAEELGAEIVKLFPGNVLGPEFIKGLKGPMPWTSVMVTGGVAPDQENLAGWFSAGASCVGMGSSLVTKEIVRNKDWEKLEGQVSSAMEIIRSIK